MIQQFILRVEELLGRLENQLQSYIATWNIMASHETNLCPLVQANSATHLSHGLSTAFFSQRNSFPFDGAKPRQNQKKTGCSCPVAVTTSMSSRSSRRTTCQESSDPSLVEDIAGGSAAEGSAGSTSWQRPRMAASAAFFLADFLLLACATRGCQQACALV